MDPKLRITPDDLADPGVDEILEEQRAVRAMAARAEELSLLRRTMFSSVFYTAFVGMVGAFLAWVFIEPMYEDVTTVTGAIVRVHPEATLGACQQCQKLFPADGTAQDAPKCPQCGTPLETDLASPVRGMFELAKTHVYVVPGMTKRSRGGSAQVIKSASELSAEQRVRIRGQIPGDQAFFATQSLIAYKVEMDPPSAPNEQRGEPDLAAVWKTTDRINTFWFAIIGGLIALMIGSVEGIASLNFRQALFCGGVGLGVGFLGGLLGGYLADQLYGAAQQLTARLAGEEGSGGIEDLHGWVLFAQTAGRSLAWGAVGTALALGQGIARRSKKLIVNGLLGGCLGGLFGGMLFDPICKLSGGEGAELSRAVGFTTIGLLVGLMLGLVEHLAKEAWLLLRTGPLAGKQFIIHRLSTSIGGSPQCDVYLFKDPEVQARHAVLTRVGRAYEIQDLDTPSGTFVNGQKIVKRVLRDGDQVTIGSTELEYRWRGY